MLDNDNENDNDNDNQNGLINIDELAYKLKQRIDNIHHEAIYHIDWLCNKQDGVNCIATCSGDNSFKIFYQNSNNNKNEKWQLLIQQNNAHKNDINWIEFGPRINEGLYLIATASDDNTTKIWQFQTSTNPNKFLTKEEVAYNDIVNEIDYSSFFKKLG